MRPIRFALSCSVVAALLAAAPLALAQPQTPPSREALAQARSLFEQGVTAVDRQEWDLALDFFTRSRAIAERPSTVLNMATALTHLARFRDAVRAFEDYLRIADPRADAAGRADAQMLMGQARAQVSHVVVTLEPPDATISVDGQPTPAGGARRDLDVDPGRHSFDVRAAGYRAETFTIQVAAGQHVEHPVTLTREVVAPTTGTIVVTTTMPGAAIAIDGAPAGQGSVRRDVAPGRHTVDVRAEGIEPVSQIVTVVAGQTVTVSPSLVAHEGGGGVFSSPVFWIVVGVVVVGGVTVAIVATSGGGQNDPYRGTTGVSGEALVRF